jgi:cyclohexadieny/prephenate dehydrogenase
MIPRLALIGLGLIGSSIAHASKRGDLVGEIVGYARSEETRKTALDLGFIDRACESAAEAVKDADLVILCTPVGTVAAITKEIAPFLKQGAIVSDAGSVKASVIEQALPNIPQGVHLVPAHPVAGTEKSGPTSGFATLFDNRWCIITPVSGTDPEAIKTVENFWKALGSNVEIMTPEHHDRVLAVTSHIPHLIAYTICGTASELETVTGSEVIKFSAAGFRDFTRIAASDPTMWRDVFLHNKDATLEVLGRLTEDIFALQRAIRKGDGDMLHEQFTRTRAIRRNIVEAGQDTDADNFGREMSKKN